MNPYDIRYPLHAFLRFLEYLHSPTAPFRAAVIWHCEIEFDVFAHSDGEF